MKKEAEQKKLQAERIDRRLVISEFATTTNFLVVVVFFMSSIYAYVFFFFFSRHRHHHTLTAMFFFFFFLNRIDIITTCCCCCCVVIVVVDKWQIIDCLCVFLCFVFDLFVYHISHTFYFICCSLLSLSLSRHNDRRRRLKTPTKRWLKRNARRLARTRRRSRRLKKKRASTRWM